MSLNAGDKVESTGIPYTLDILKIYTIANIGRNIEQLDGELRG